VGARRGSEGKDKNIVHLFNLPKHAISSETLNFFYSANHESKVAYQPNNPDSIFTTFQKYTFNIYQITTSEGKFKIFLAR